MINLFFTLMALYGTYLNAHQKREGFYFWILSNIYMSFYNLCIGEYAFGLLFATYTGLAIQGLRKWKK